MWFLCGFPKIQNFRSPDFIWRVSSNPTPPRTANRQYNTTANREPPTPPWTMNRQHHHEPRTANTTTNREPPTPPRTTNRQYHHEPWTVNTTVNREPRTTNREPRTANTTTNHEPPIPSRIINIINTIMNHQYHQWIINIIRYQYDSDDIDGSRWYWWFVVGGGIGGWRWCWWLAVRDDIDGSWVYRLKFESKFQSEP
jgi:hypothetical protein